MYSGGAGLAKCAVEVWPSCPATIGVRLRGSSLGVLLRARALPDELEGRD